MKYYYIYRCKSRYNNHLYTYGFISSYNRRESWSRCAWKHDLVVWQHIENVYIFMRWNNISCKVNSVLSHTDTMEMDFIIDLHWNAGLKSFNIRISYHLELCTIYTNHNVISHSITCKLHFLLGFHCQVKCRNAQNSWKKISMY